MSLFPECKIGNCAGCQTFPIVIFQLYSVDVWRCVTCYSKIVGEYPFPLDDITRHGLNESIIGRSENEILREALGDALRAASGLVNGRNITESTRLFEVVTICRAAIAKMRTPT